VLHLIEVIQFKFYLQFFNNNCDDQKFKNFQRVVRVEVYCGVHSSSHVLDGKDLVACARILVNALN